MALIVIFLQGVVASQILLVDCSNFCFSLWEVRMYHHIRSRNLSTFVLMTIVNSTQKLCFMLCIEVDQDNS